MTPIHRWMAAAVLAAAFAPNADAASVTRGPYLQSGTAMSVIVRWRTDVATDSRVSHGAAPGNLTSFVDNLTSTTEHEIKIENLLPDTIYYYAVGTTAGILAGNDATHFFLTAPMTGTPKPTRIWVLGDSGTANASAAAVRNAYYAFTGSRHTDLWLMLGDNAYTDGTDSEYQAAVFNMYPTMLRKSVLWPTLGNHDGHSADSGTQSGPYYDIFTLPRNGEAGGTASGTEAYYSFDYGNVHWIVLDSFGSDRSPFGPMMTWLQADLATTTQDWIIAYWHHPPYSKGSHDSDSEGGLRDMRENALPVLEAGGVDLVLSGHSHSYERSFLLDGHYGTSTTLQPSMILDGGDGRPTGNGAYQKPVLGPVAHEGAVYTVAGSSGKTSGGTLDHPAMFISLDVLGSVVLDLDGNRLDAIFLDSTGAIRDTFTLLKPPAGNQSPAVSAGADQSIALPSGVSLDGNVSDDGLPNPPGLTTTLWSVESGPGAALFGDANAVDTTASFSTAGTYVLRLTAYDGELTSFDETTTTVYPEATNQPPAVQATATPIVFLPASATLGGTVGDDGLPNPPGMVTTSWSTLSGPGPVSFADASAIDTTASFTTSGTYVLRLTADDGAATGWSDVTVTVRQPPQMIEVRVSTSTDDAEESSSGSVNLTSSDLELIRESTNQTVGMRFNGVNIPAGSLIASAYIQFQVDEVATEITLLTIQAQAIDTAPTFTTTSNSISTRARTVASVAWSPPPWNTVGQAGADQRTPNIASAIEEVVDRPGWVSGNSLVIVVTGTGKRVAESYNGAPAGAPLLHVELGPAGPPVNQPPSVAAGPDQTVTLPSNVTLDGTVSDDGLPSPPASVATTWSVASGPGIVTFADPNAVDTSASFSTDGIYVLRLTGDDGELSVSDDVTLTIQPEPPNQAPSVNAGVDQTISLPAAALLDGTVSDDGKPSPPSITATWSQTSGPGAVTFGSENAVDTSASFSQAGVYVLRLTAHDGELTNWDEIAVTVNPPNQPPTVSAGSDQTVTLPASASLDGTVSDDGQPNPPGAVTLAWSQVSGPGSVSFENPSSVDTTASFSSTGAYLLRLTADDGALTASHEMTVTVDGASIVTLDIRVSASSDDGEERSSGSVNLTSGDLEIIRDGTNDQTVGMRFRGVSIPQGSLISNAYIQFQVDEAKNEPGVLTIQAQAIDNAPTFTTTSGSISTRARTAASVFWSPPPWSTVGQAGPDQRTPDISSVIQEVVERAGWASGNALVIVITGTGKRVAESYNGGAAAAPLLHVEFAPSSGN